MNKFGLWLFGGILFWATIIGALGCVVAYHFISKFW